MIKIALSGPKGAGLFTYFSDCDADIAHLYPWNLHKVKYQPVGYASTSRMKGGKDFRLYAARLVLEKMLGRPLVKGEIAEHKDGCLSTLNNQRENIRLADGVKNGQNCGMQINNSSGYKGVHVNCNRKKWIATLRYRGKMFYGSQTADKEEAARAFDCIAHLIQDADFAVFNFPDECFELKWRIIGERQRSQILHSVGLFFSGYDVRKNPVKRGER